MTVARAAQGPAATAEWLRDVVDKMEHYLRQWLAWPFMLRAAWHHAPGQPRTRKPSTAPEP